MTEENKIDPSVELETLREKHNSVLAKLTDFEKRFGGVDLEKLKADAEAAKILQGQLEEEKKKKATGSTTQEDFEKEWEKRQAELIRKNQDAYKTEVEPLKAELETYKSREYERTVVDGALSSLAQQIIPGSDDFWRDMIRKEIKKDETGAFVVVDEKGQVVYTDGRTAQSLAEWVEAKKVKYPFLVADRTNTGAHSGSDSNRPTSGALTPPKNASEDELIEFYKKNVGKITRPIMS